MIQTSSPAASSKADVPTFSGAVGFTPGPWSFEYHGHPDNGYIIAAGAYPYGKDVAWVSENTDAPKANARLIAASPALYDAGEIAEYAIDRYLDEPCHINREGLEKALKRLSAALKQARGE